MRLGAEKATPQKETHDYSRAQVDAWFQRYSRKSTNVSKDKGNWSLERNVPATLDSLDWTMVCHSRHLFHYWRHTNLVCSQISVSALGVHWGSISQRALCQRGLLVVRGSREDFWFRWWVESPKPIVLVAICSLHLFRSMMCCWTWLCIFYFAMYLVTYTSGAHRELTEKVVST